MYRRTKRIDGQKFGSLTALTPSHMVGKQVYYHFRCDCGEVKVFRKSNVVSESKGNARHCGCLAGRENLIGRKFNMLSVISKVHPTKGRHGMIYECRCDCGKELRVSAKHLKQGQVSCGCIIGESHNESRPPTPEYIAWGRMIARCYNPKSTGFENYGGRGITVCDEWRESYLAFISHIGRRPTESHSIGRIDNSGNYEPGNVRWETMIQQNNNKRNNSIIEFDGRRMTGAQWDRHLGVPSGMTRGRINRGWSVRKAITTPNTYGRHT